MVRRTNTLSLIFALAVMGVVVLWWKKPRQFGANAANNDQRNGGQRDAPFQIEYLARKHWYPSEDDYKARETNWGRQNLIGCVGLVIGALTLAAAVGAGLTALGAYNTGLDNLTQAKNKRDKRSGKPKPPKTKSQLRKMPKKSSCGLICSSDQRSLQPPNLASEEPRVAFHLHVLGSGSTPATNITTLTIPHDFPYPLPDPFDLPLDYVTDNIGFSATESPEIDPVYLPLDQQKIAEFKNKKRLAYVYGHLGYYDAFRQHWSVEYCFLYNWSNISGTGNPTVCPWHNERKRDELKQIDASELERARRERPKTRRVPSFKIGIMENPPK